MKTPVEFRSSKYLAYDVKEEQINPGLWGKRLAECFVQKFSEKGTVWEVISYCVSLVLDTLCVGD